MKFDRFVLEAGAPRTIGRTVNKAVNLIPVLALRLGKGLRRKERKDDHI